MDNEPLKIVKPSWELLGLVCKACQKRGNGPKGLKSKKFGQAIRVAGKARGLKSRIVMTSCMGLCPKGATAVTLIKRGASPQTAAMTTADQADAWVDALSEAPKPENVVVLMPTRR